MSFLPTAPPPKSPLARYRILSPTASVRVSPLCLGSMNFGDAWKENMGACDKDTVFQILDFFYDQGGNFIDTSSNYQFEESETWIGEWMKKRGVRDQMVIATKYTTNFRANHTDEISINFQGNGTKSMHTSVRRSLEKLQTDYIDLLYVHWWDFSTSIPEVMQSLNQLVLSGKVLYLGVSDTPAWVVSKANEYARNHGLRQFSVYQGRWSAASRDFEREIIPMAKAEGMGLAPWGALGGGKFKTEEQRKKNEGRSYPPTEIETKVSKALETVAKRKSTIITSVAQAYVMHKTPYVFPIVGGRTLDHLKANIEALNLSLSEDDIQEIESAAPFDIGFPMNFAYRGDAKHPGEVWLLNMGGITDYVPEPKPIAARKTGE
ncbi:norsolorinic acid reductase [Xylaria bambusicola]|uniref:norsolorinic acid reductase n=1 Tax=Xylaria bambusicola TaxID=326684 RepID=UPI00200836D4|nr:norsolorinic acid reductase [Xylaria bambusicola]KAI0520819.1 norsolorinic acid reductase [Xylaria bambusicola]